MTGDGEKLFTAKSVRERLFKHDVCRLGRCPDFRVSITTNKEVLVDDEVSEALMALDSKFRSSSLGSERAEAFQSFQASTKRKPLCGLQLHSCTFRDTMIWMDRQEKIEIHVSQAFELTGVTKPDEQSEDDNFEIRFSSHELTNAVQRNDDGAWNRMETLLSTVQMLHDSLRDETDP